jgi:hypothetical protein
VTEFKINAGKLLIEDERASAASPSPARGANPPPKTPGNGFKVATGGGWQDPGHREYDVPRKTNPNYNEADAWATIRSLREAAKRDPKRKEKIDAAIRVIRRDILDIREGSVLSATSSRSRGEVQQAFLGGPDFQVGQPGT